MDKASFCEAMNNQLVALVRRAGKAILTIYDSESPIQIHTKADTSPVTAADLAAHHILIAGLKAILDIPVLSEEGEQPDFIERSAWLRYWLIDPLDGTKEFILRNGEFTVNVALIEAGKPVLGVVHVPVKDVTYLGINPQDADAKKAQKYLHGTSPKTICIRPLQAIYDHHKPLIVLLSRRHGIDELHDLLARLQLHWPGTVEQICAGSSLKFCLIAEGVADFYPRLAPTSEWDTAAAQAVLEAAGGAVIEAEPFGHGEYQPLCYNTGVAIINPKFYALGDSQFDWLALFSSRIMLSRDDSNEQGV